MANSLQVCLQILSQNTTDLIEGFGFDIKKARTKKGRTDGDSSYAM